MCRDMSMCGQFGAALRTCLGILIMPPFGTMLPRRTRGVNVQHKRPHAHFAKSLVTLPNMMNFSPPSAICFLPGKKAVYVLSLRAFLLIMQYLLSADVKGR